MSRLGEFANIYELLDESDSSGVETGKKAQVALAEKKAAAAAALAPSQPRPPAQAGSKPQGQRPAGERQGGNSERGPRTDRPRGDRPPRTDRPREDRPPRTDRPREDRPPRTDRPPRPRPVGDSPREGESSFSAEGQAAAGGAPRPHLPHGERRGPRPDRGYERRNPGDQDQRPRREFDRRSGTGRGKEVSKGGSGKGNWGSIEDEAAAGLGDVAQAAQTETKKEGEETVTEVPADSVEAAAPEEEEPKTRTLEDYLKEKTSKQAASLPPPRQAGEGEASGAWEKYSAFEKKEETLFAVSEKESKKKESKKESSEKKVAADQVLKFQQERRERPERTERGDREKGDRRGGERTSAPRGGHQGGQKRGAGGPALKFDDKNAFPTLSTKA